MDQHEQHNSARSADEPSVEPRLSAQDAEAIDRWMDERDDTASPAARLVALLGIPPGDIDETDATLVDATVLRVSRAITPSVAAPDPELDRLSSEALDAWALAGFSAERTPGDLRDRAVRLDAMVRAVSETPTPASSRDLVSRTMARVKETAAHEPIPMRGSRFRMTDLFSAAAVLLIAASVLWPMMANARASSERAMCEANFGATGRAFSAYANGNAGQLPMATAGFGQASRPASDRANEAPAPWWDVGSRERPANSAHLYVLVRESYAELSDLACPGNPMAPRRQTDPSAVDWSSLDEISYSYQLFEGAPTPVWLRPSWGILLADRSPVVQRAVRGETVDPFANSDNHDRRGQHALRVDGSSVWLTSPVLSSGDNIWLPRQLEDAIEAVSGVRLRGLERPDGPDDAFVGP